jgi:hypothetical protein
MFTQRSRYATVPDAVHEDPDGRRIPHKQLRRIPAEAPVHEAHVVDEGDRFDLVAFAHYGDPEQFWRICDANRGMWPDDLLAAPGRQLVVPVAG